jgi:LPS-assembly protein
MDQLAWATAKDRGRLRPPALTLAFVTAALPAALAAGQKPPFPAELENPQTTVGIRADSQEKIGDLYKLRGHVEITYRDMKLTADEVTYNDATSDVDARGHVVFEDPQAHIEASSAHYNLTGQKGWFTEGSGYFHPKIRPNSRVLKTENPFYVRAARFERKDEQAYSIRDGSMTSCENVKCGWQMGASQADIQVGDKVVSRGATFRFFRIPLFYSPYLVDSIAPRSRSTGFLLPHVGTSTQKGFIIGDGFFWAINPSADLLVGAENYSVRGVARHAQFRAQPSADSDLTLIYYGVNDKGSGPLRAVRAGGQSLRAVGEARDLGFGFRGVVDVDYISSLAFRETWSESFAQAVASEARQTGFATKNFGPYSLNFYASRYQDFLCAQGATTVAATVSSQPCPASPNESGNLVSIRELPSFSFSGMDQKVGNSPFFFSFDASAAAVGRTEPGLETGLAERLDVHPEVTLRTRPFWGFYLTPSFGFEATRYGTSLRPDRRPIQRGLGEISADLRPPSFDKVFAKEFKGYRIKHLIEPEIQYRLVRSTDREDFVDIVRFDEMDVFTETHEVEYSLTNSLLARKDTSDASGDPPQTQDLVSWRIAQKYYFDPTFGGAIQPGQLGVFEPALDLTGFAFARGRRLSPIDSVLKLAPSSTYDTELRADINPSGGGVLNAGVTSNLHRGPLGLAMTDFFINKTAALPEPLAQTVNLSQLPSFNLLQAIVTYGKVNRKGLSAAFGADYNFAQGITHQLVSQVSYNFGCFGLDFEYRRINVGILRNEQQYRMALSLANVGTFGNLRPRERLY